MTSSVLRLVCFALALAVSAMGQVDTVSADRAAPDAAPATTRPASTRAGMTPTGAAPADTMLAGLSDDWAYAVAQQAYLKASNTDGGDRFGIAVSISGNTLVVGAREEDSAATGVDGDQSDNTAFGAGAVYVFVRDGSTWSQQAYLKASNTNTEGNLDWFGNALSISGDTLVVGAPREGSSATGVNGDQDNNDALKSGAAYVFVRDGTTWSQQAYLKASNTGGSIGTVPPGDAFGTSVSISGDTIVIGAPTEDSSATGVNGDQGNDLVKDSGASYVFVRNGTTWRQQAYLKASNTGEDDNFGHSVSICGDTLVVGARQESSSATGVDGDQNDDSAESSGAAYVFVRDGSTWSQQAYLKASNTDASLFQPDIADNFGWSVSISDDTLVVGALGEDSASAGVNGDQSDNSALAAGAAYVFVRDGATWSQQAYLKSSDPGGGSYNPFEPLFLDDYDGFGQAVSISGDTVVVGVWGDDSAATGIDGDQFDNSIPDSGAAYVFVRDGTTWSQQVYLKASNSGLEDFFGDAVAISRHTIVAGAPSERSAATGVDGDQLDNSAQWAGAAYVFDVTPSSWTDLGFALAGTNGDPALLGTGLLIEGAEPVIALSGAAGNAPAFLVVGFAPLYHAPFRGGTLVPDASPPGFIVSLVTNGAGAVSLSTQWPAGVPSGLELYLQYWILDPGGPLGYAASNAILGIAP